MLKFNDKPWRKDLEVEFECSAVEHCHWRRRSRNAARNRSCRSKRTFLLAATEIKFEIHTNIRVFKFYNQIIELKVE